MAEVILTAGPDGTRLMRRMTADYKAGRLTNQPQKPVPTVPTSGWRLGKVVTSEIAAESSGDVQLQDADWVDSGEDIITVRNDHAIALPVGTKLYIQVIQNKWRVVIPFVECP